MKTKPNRTFTWYLENGMFFIYLILWVMFTSLNGISGNVYGVNKTVNWLYDISSSFNLYYTLYSEVVYFLGFLILLVVKKKTNKKLALIFLTLILFFNLSESLNLIEYDKAYILKVITFIVFVIMFFNSFFRKEKRNS